MSEKASVTKKGQVTIPKKIRDKLGLKEGMKVTFQLKGKEAILLPEAQNPLEELRELREEVKFSEEEIEAMIEESKEKWSKLGR